MKLIQDISVQFVLYKSLYGWCIYHAYSITQYNIGLNSRHLLRMQDILFYIGSQLEWKETSSYVRELKILGLTAWTQRICACSSVIYCDVTEQVSHGLSIVDASDGLGQDHTDVHCLDLGTLELLDLMRDCIGHHHLGGTRTQNGEPGFSRTYV